MASAEPELIIEDIKEIIKIPTKTGEPIVNKINKCLAANKTFYSFEFFPPKRREGVQNLYSRLDRMAQLEPMFMDITWGAGGTTADLTLEISANAQNFTASEVMMHLTCTNMPREAVTEALEKAKAAGIRNILALRGDPPKGAEAWEQCENGFAYAVDLVRHIREQYGDYFGIAVAGYPEAHIQSKSVEEDLMYLKEKVDAGADFIITQLFYDCDLFIDWVRRCREVGITVPIVPGIMPIQSYSGFLRMVGFCKTKVPQEIYDALEPIKDDEEAVKAYGIQLGIKMCEKLLASGLIPGLHFYTLNLERSVGQILDSLGYLNTTQSQRYPWKQASVARRAKEEVRPIFWANRPQSYLDRTKFWDEFPNGRWGDSASPAFGDLSDYHLYSFKTGTREDRRKIWGSSPSSLSDIYSIFVKYLQGEVPRLPWCEDSLQLETSSLRDQLIKMNSNGFLTINSQPRVNGASSSDSAVGWGGPGGYVYQKAYLEFFTNEENVNKIAQVAKEFPFITYHAINVKGNTLSSMSSDSLSSVNAVTWGVFPNKQIIQPTVVEYDSFNAWKDEAFALWRSQWQTIYSENSEPSNLVQNIHDTFYLVNVVDNDYINGDIFAFFEKVLSL